MPEYDVSLRDQVAINLRYFWEEKGDVERWVGWDQHAVFIQQEFPEVVKAWNDYQVAIKIMNAVVKSL